MLATSLHAAPPKPYHIVLEANPAAAFPFLSRFGTVTLDVYAAGVRAETLWLNGFTRKGTSAVTVENPLGRMYTDVPLPQIRTTLRKLSTSGVENAAPVRITQIKLEVSSSTLSECSTSGRRQRREGDVSERLRPHAAAAADRGCICTVSRSCSSSPAVA